MMFLPYAVQATSRHTCGAKRQRRNTAGTTFQATIQAGLDVVAIQHHLLCATATLPNLPPHSWFDSISTCCVAAYGVRNTTFRVAWNEIEFVDLERFLSLTLP